MSIKSCVKKGSEDLLLPTNNCFQELCGGSVVKVELDFDSAAARWDFSVRIACHMMYIPKPKSVPNKIIFTVATPRAIVSHDSDLSSVPAALINMADAIKPITLVIIRTLVIATISVKNCETSFIGVQYAIQRKRQKKASLLCHFQKIQNE